MAAEVTKVGVLDMQVCVPATWTDEQVIQFAEQENPCGTVCGWFIRKQGDPLLEKAPERTPCAHHKGYVHIMLDA